MLSYLNQALFPPSSLPVFSSAMQVYAPRVQPTSLPVHALCYTKFYTFFYFEYVILHTHTLEVGVEPRLLVTPSTVGISSNDVFIITLAIIYLGLTFSPRDLCILSLCACMCVCCLCYGRYPLPLPHPTLPLRWTWLQSACEPVFSFAISLLLVDARVQPPPARAPTALLLSWEGRRGV